MKKKNNLKCACGSENFKSDKVHITFFGIPCTITAEGPEYDDRAAEYSRGWNFYEDDQVLCIRCDRIYTLDTDQQGNIVLTLNESS